MTSHRKFTPSVEAIGQVWRNEVLSSETWAPAPGAKVAEAGGQAAGYFVTSGALRAFAKPSQRNDGIARAAHEKIVSDLAFDLELPVPPVVLYDWGTPPLGEQRFVAMSLCPFGPAHKWETVKAAKADAQIAVMMQAAASAMVPFDTWVGNTDRHNGGNLIVNQETGGPHAAVRCAYIDFSYSLSHTWPAPGAFVNVNPVGLYPIDPAAVDNVALSYSVERIEAVSDEAIVAIVSRIPREFLTEPQSELIIDGLKGRRARVRDALRPLHAGAAL